jgi:hypothetical protein
MALYLFASSDAAASTLTFDDVPLNGSGNPDLTINGGYGGLSWIGSWNVVTSLGALTGGNPVPLGVQHPVESSPGSCCVLAPFNFLGADFGPYQFGQNPLNVAGYIHMTGWANGVQVYSLTTQLAASGFTHITAGFMGIDSLSIQPFAASSHSTGYPAFVMDNFEYSFEGQGGGTAPVPEPSTLLLVGSGALGMLARRRGRRH